MNEYIVIWNDIKKLNVFLGNMLLWLIKFVNDVCL